MWKCVLVFISINIKVSGSARTYSHRIDVCSNRNFMDYLRPSIITSSLPRSKKSAFRTHFNWNDFDTEKENLEEIYPPIVDVSYGTPNYMPSQTVVNALVQVAHNQSDPGSYEIHQYTRSRGHPRLIKIVAEFYSFLMKRNLDPLREVLITAGSLNSLDLAARAYINPGDEVILFEPFYEEYRKYITFSGGIMVPVPLRHRPGSSGANSNDWTFDKIELESKITSRTKLIWLNNPNNPLGKVYTLDELSFIGFLAKKYDLIVLVDEAAQWYYYEEPYHLRIATLPGLFERTITLTSGGKTFSNTGWRIGWVIAPEPLLWPMAIIIETGMCCVSTPMQIAFATGMERELQLWGTQESHFVQMRARAKRARDQIVSILKYIGVDFVVPTAGYCVVSNFTKLVNQINLAPYRDPRPGLTLYKYFLIKEKVAVYPLAPFYNLKNIWQTEYLIRFTFFKTQETLDMLGQILSSIFRPVHNHGYINMFNKVNQQIF